MTQLQVVGDLQQNEESNFNWQEKLHKCGHGETVIGTWQNQLPWQAWRLIGLLSVQAGICPILTTIKNAWPCEFSRIERLPEGRKRFSLEVGCSSDFQSLV